MTRRDRPSALPWRGGADESPGDLGVPVPPAPMRPWRGGRPLKRWRYVAAFSPEVMLCAGAARIGPGATSWWAVWDRDRGELHERTRIGRGRVRFDGSRLRVRDATVEIDVEVDEGAAVESVNPHGAQYVWTRKQAARPARGRVVLPARTLLIDALAVVDDTAGYHARETAWRWAAGVGHDGAGTVVGWNLVTGVNDGPSGSERSVWIDGAVREVGPVAFADDLSSVAFAEGAELRFGEESVRERRDRLVVFASDYRQPFGAITGTMPGVRGQIQGFGVMERHSARW